MQFLDRLQRIRRVLRAYNSVAVFLSASSYLLSITYEATAFATQFFRKTLGILVPGSVPTSSSQNVTICPESLKALDELKFKGFF